MVHNEVSTQCEYKNERHLQQVDKVFRCILFTGMENKLEWIEILENIEIKDSIGTEWGKSAI